MKISYQTIGCKLNQAETEELKTALEHAGFLTVPFGQKTDICVIRACAVTCGASQTTREVIRRVKRDGAHVVVGGCLENYLPEIDFAAKTNPEIYQYLTTRFPAAPPQKSTVKHRTRAMIKIQTGCDFQCAYCVIPAYRGKNRGEPLKKIIDKIRTAEQAGYREIILTGVNIGQYRDRGHGLTGLLVNILKKTAVPRIRLGSLDPRLISPELIKLFAGQPRLLPHWHLSLQSGADSVLKRMSRHYTVKKYQETVRRLRRHNPLFSLTTDVIVGFPGETDREFQATGEFIKKIGFAKVHIFPYSRRPGTAADNFPDQVPDRTKTARAKKIRAVAEQTAQDYARRLIGLTRPVLFEQKKSGGWFGYTPEYLPVIYNNPANLRDKIKNIKLTAKILGL